MLSVLIALGDGVRGLEIQTAPLGHVCTWPTPATTLQQRAAGLVREPDRPRVALARRLGEKATVYAIEGVATRPANMASRMSSIWVQCLITN